MENPIELLPRVLIHNPRRPNPSDIEALRDLKVRVPKDVCGSAIERALDFANDVISRTGRLDNKDRQLIKEHFEEDIADHPGV